MLVIISKDAKLTNDSGIKSQQKSAVILEYY